MLQHIITLLLKHFFNISKTNLYKHIKKPLAIETIEKAKADAVRP